MRQTLRLVKYHPNPLVWRYPVSVAYDLLGLVSFPTYICLECANIYIRLHCIDSMKRTGAGRPPADEVHTEAAKQVLDANKISTGDKTDELLNRANEMLSNTAKSTLLDAANLSARKAVVLAKRELREAQEEESEFAPRQGIFKINGMSADDIRTMAESLPEAQREPFIRQALGMPNSGNPMMGAFLQQKAQPAAAAPLEHSGPMTLGEALQSMMGLMTMQMTAQQSRAEEWRQQQEFERAAHERRIEEIREARGETQQQGPNPEIEALKLQMEFYKDTIKEHQALIKEMAANKPTDAVDAMRKENFELTKSILEGQKASMEEKVRSMEARLGDANRNTMNLGEIIKAANANGANLHQGDSTDLQVANDHEYKMRQLEIQETRIANEQNARQAEAEARAAEASRTVETVKTLAATLGTALVQSRMAPKKDLPTSSNPIQRIAGAVQ